MGDALLLNLRNGCGRHTLLAGSCYGARNECGQSQRASESYNKRQGQSLSSDTRPDRRLIEHAHGLGLYATFTIDCLPSRQELPPHNPSKLTRCTTKTPLQRSGYDLHRPSCLLLMLAFT